MTLVADKDLALIEALCDGLPMHPHPYHVLGQRVDMSEDQVIETLKRLINDGVIKRFGVVVQHRKLGYTANAMTVWDIPDDRLDEIGVSMGRLPFVTLCYQRPRRLPDWPYNLFAMVHGSERNKVLEQVECMAKVLDLETVQRDALFSRRQFKQCGARYKQRREETRS